MDSHLTPGVGDESDVARGNGDVFDGKRLVPVRPGGKAKTSWYIQTPESE